MDQLAKSLLGHELRLTPAVTYKLTKLLGSGSFAIVFKAQLQSKASSAPVEDDENITSVALVSKPERAGEYPQQVAVKVLFKQSLNPAQLALQHQEALIMAQGKITCCALLLFESPSSSTYL